MTPEVVTVLGIDGTVWATSGGVPAPGTTVWAALHPDDHDPLRTALERVAAGDGVAGPVPFRLVGVDGPWFLGTATVTAVAARAPLGPAVVVHARACGRRTAQDEGRRAALATALAGALDGGGLRLVYQPKVDLLTDRVAGVEALLRWDDPVLGPVSPAEFIPVAEATGLILPIGAWVLHEACRQGAQWQRAHPRTPPLLVQVNVSAEQLRAGLVDTVRSAVERSGIDPCDLAVEVTESTVMEDVDAAIVLLGQLRALGLGVSLDDFGTGYSSLQYLRRLPVDEVKVDRSFVAGVATDRQDTAIVAAVISMSHAMDRTVVAEGVETPAQLSRLRALGCDQAQGFLLARPMPPGELSAHLAAEAAGRAGAAPVVPGGETVVLADDAGDVRQLARMSLAAAGFAVEEASDGRAALELVRRVGAVCAVLDVNMPGLGGIEVCRRLRADPQTGSCTVVMLTDSDKAADKTAAFAAGADDYLVKPFTPRDLVTRVRTAVVRHRRR